jgi:hypothetical protein
MALKITMTMVVDDESILVDPATLRDDYGGDWLKCVKSFVESEGKLFFPCEWPDRFEYVSAELVSEAPQGGELEGVLAPEGQKP